MITATGQPVDLAEYPSSWLRVTPRRSTLDSLEKASNVSEVSEGRAHVAPFRLVPLEKENKTSVSCAYSLDFLSKNSFLNFNYLL